MNTFCSFVYLPGIALAPHLGYIPPFPRKGPLQNIKNPLRNQHYQAPPFLYFPGASVRERPAGGRIEKGGGRKAGGASFPPRGLRERETERSEETVFFREVIQSSSSSSVLYIGKACLPQQTVRPTGRQWRRGFFPCTFLLFREFVFLPSSSFFAHNRSGGRASRSSSSLEQDPFDKFSPLPPPPPSPFSLLPAGGGNDSPSANLPASANTRRDQV